MLVMDIEAADLSERTLIKFFARAHSVDAALEGWRLALWCPRRPAALADVSDASAQSDIPAGMVAFGWAEGGVKQSKAKKAKKGQKGQKSKPSKLDQGQNKTLHVALVPVAAVLAHPALIEAGQQVVLARRELPAGVFELLRETLGYEPDLETQLPGWWYGFDDELPDREPPWRPTGALVPALASRPGGEGEGDCGDGAGPADLRDGARCLVMVEVDDCWLVLSERGLRTYAFGQRLADGEGVRFVRKTGTGLEVWRVMAAGVIDVADIGARFGAEAAERARKDAPAVLVTVSREPGGEPVP